MGRNAKNHLWGRKRHNWSRSKIIQDLMVEMYVEKGYSLIQVANELECALGTVRYRLLKLGIKLRPNVSTKKINGCKVCGGETISKPPVAWCKKHWRIHVSEVKTAWRRRNENNTRS